VRKKNKSYSLTISIPLSGHPNLPERGLTDIVSELCASLTELHRSKLPDFPEIELDDDARDRLDCIQQSISEVIAISKLGPKVLRPQVLFCCLTKPLEELTEAARKVVEERFIKDIDLLEETMKESASERIQALSDVETILADAEIQREVEMPRRQSEPTAKSKRLEWPPSDGDEDKWFADFDAEAERVLAQSRRTIAQTKRMLADSSAGVYRDLAQWDALLGSAKIGLVRSFLRRIRRRRRRITMKWWKWRALSFPLRYVQYLPLFVTLLLGVLVGVVLDPLTGFAFVALGVLLNWLLGSMLGNAVEKQSARWLANLYAKACCEVGLLEAELAELRPFSAKIAMPYKSIFPKNALHNLRKALEDLSSS
jgi:hypothetical protein